jgi:hypothetical protein
VYGRTNVLQILIASFQGSGMMEGMITKIALVFCGVILAGVFGNLYFMALTMITSFLLRIDNAIVWEVEYWICFVTGAVTAFGLMRQGWPSRKKEKQV